MVVSEKNLSTRREEYEEKGLKNILKGKKKKRRIHTLKPGRIMHYQIGPDRYRTITQKSVMSYPMVTGSIL